MAKKPTDFEKIESLPTYCVRAHVSGRTKRLIIQDAKRGEKITEIVKIALNIHYQKDPRL